MLETYKNVIMNVMQMLFGKVQNISEETDGIIELETKLAEIMCKSFFFLPSTISNEQFDKNEFNDLSANRETCQHRKSLQQSQIGRYEQKSFEILRLDEIF